MSILLPVYLMLLLGMLEFGLAFDHLLSISYASREGARVGAALTNGGGTLGCGTGQSPNAGSVDPQIAAAVERVLTSPGSLVEIQNVSQIRIYLATSTGAETTGKVNVWTYAEGAGPIVDGSRVDFIASSSPWTPCSRSNSLPAASIGVALVYRYDFTTPLGGILAIVGGHGQSSLPIQDKTVMAMNPNQ
jgi:Flp pilus assembly protein TadG